MNHDKCGTASFPRCHKPQCWKRHFTINPGRTLALKRAIDDGKESAIVDTAGKTFTKMLKRFLRGEL